MAERRLPQILVVEDNGDKKLIYERKLQDAGYQSLCPPDEIKDIQAMLEWATDLSRHQEFDVIILDLRMTDLDREEKKQMVYAGIEIYLGLRREYVLDRCGHIIIASKMVTPAIQNATSDKPEYAVKVLIELADIPWASVICVAQSGGYDDVVTRIRDLLAG